MSPTFPGMGPGAWQEAFPFHLILCPDLRLLSCGRSLQRLVPDLRAGDAFTTHFRIQRPRVASRFDDLRARPRDVFVVAALARERLVLRGQMLALEGEAAVAFLASPWVRDLAEMRSLGIGLHELPAHDSTPDLLILLQTQRTSLHDAARLAEALQELNRELDARVRERTADLEAANVRLQERTQALVLARQRLDDLVNSIDAIVWEADLDSGRCTFISRSVERLLGWPAERFLEDETLWRDLMAGGSPGMRDADRGRFDVEIALRTREGGEIWVRDLAAVVHGLDGAPRLRGVMVDVTERRRLEGQLRHASKMEAGGSLAAGIAHEFNNLLTSVMGNAESLRGSLPAESLNRQLLDDVIAAAEHGAALTSQLLAFGRRQVLRPRPLDLNRLIEDSAGMLRTLAGENVEVAFRLERDLPPVLADPSQIEQVLIMLVAHVRHAMPQAGRLELSTASADAQVLLEVRDDGGGMDDEMRQRIFEPFFRPRGMAEDEGIGLAAVYGIVGQSGGSVSVVSRPGEGTAFHVLLPRAGQPVPAGPSRS